MDKDCGMKSEFLSVKGVQTHVLRFGEIPSASVQPKLLFLIIPGNPGIIEYYEEFMRTIYRLSDYRMPVWGVSHAGHVTVPNQASASFSDLVQLPRAAYSLEGQIQHKIKFILDNIPSHVKLVLVGHSIGCYIILKMLEHLPNHQIIRCFMLFPTIERMAASPRGLYAAPFLRYFRWVGVWVSKLLSYFSPHMQYRLILRFFKKNSPECALNASMNLFNPKCVNNFTFMALQEMNQVDKLPKALIKKNLSKLSFYYGCGDHWCPKLYFYQMRKRFPNADMQLCQHGYSHAYVLDASKEMAQFVWSWLQKDLHKQDD